MLNKKLEAQCRELARQKKEAKEYAMHNALNGTKKHSLAFFTKDRPMRRLGRPKKRK